MSSRVIDARSYERPLSSTSQPANIANGDSTPEETDARTVITSFDTLRWGTATLMGRSYRGRRNRLPLLPWLKCRIPQYRSVYQRAKLMPPRSRRNGTSVDGMAVLFFILFSVSRYTSLMNGTQKSPQDTHINGYSADFTFGKRSQFSILATCPMSFGAFPDMTGQEQCSLQLVSTFYRSKLHITSLSTFYLLGSADSLISLAKVRKNSETTKFLASFFCCSISNFVTLGVVHYYRCR